MSKPTEQRPPQVGLASGIVMFASVVVLLTAWDRISTLGSLESQEGIRSLLAEAPFSSLDLDVPAVSEIIRITCMVAAACACATAILGWYVRKPDRSSRLALTLFAVPVFVAGIPAGGLAGSFVAAAAAMLWMQPAREWFATGRWTPPTPPSKLERADAPTDGRTSPGQGPHAGWPTTPPPAARPFGDPQAPPQENAYGQPYPQQAPQQTGQQTQQLPRPYPPHPEPGWQQPPPGGWQPRPVAPERPPAMVAAFVITMVTAGGLLAIALLFLGVAAASADVLMAEMERQQPDLFGNDLTVEQLRRTLLAFGAGFLVWSSVALALAGFAMARRDWARRGLIVCAAFSAGGCIALVASAPIVLLPAAAAIATVVCLRRVEVRRWFQLEAS